jgi:hypothetical protein
VSYAVGASSCPVAVGESPPDFDATRQNEKGRGKPKDPVTMATRRGPRTFASLVRAFLVTFDLLYLFVVVVVVVNFVFVDVTLKPRVPSCYRPFGPSPKRR